MRSIKVLVFPCGSEVGLEIHRSLKYSRHIELFGASSVKDHGKFVYENYISALPFIDDEEFLKSLKGIVDQYKIDFIYPAMDSVMAVLKNVEKHLNCQVIASCAETTNICLSKYETYKILHNTVKVPIQYDQLSDVKKYPVFLKPIVGYGSKGTKLVKAKEEGKQHLLENPDSLILEFLPGDEYTVDCFTDRRGNLLFVGPRSRSRIKTGISVNTSTLSDNGEFYSFAQRVNNTISLRGAWFFQVKRNIRGELTLLEVASRIGGSSGVFRPKGINFALLTLWDFMGKDVKIIENKISVEMDRALSCDFKIDFEFDTAYFDFDDLLIVNNKVNSELVKFIYDLVNQNKKVVLITKHKMNIMKSLKKYKLIGLFDDIIHLPQDEKKSEYISNSKAIFFDDSFEERKDVFENCGIPTFSFDYN